MAARPRAIPVPRAAGDQHQIVPHPPGSAADSCAAYTRRIAVEEDMLTGALGGAYADYSRRTNRLIPFVW